MGVKVEMLDIKEFENCFEGIVIQEKMSDQKLGAIVKIENFCLLAGGVIFHGEIRDIVAIGRKIGTKYSVFERVPLPFIVNQYGKITIKSAVIARNIVNRLSDFINKPEKILFREFLSDKERCSISYM